LKQIEFGKNTLGYARYRELVPLHERTSQHPSTPPADGALPKRRFDGLVRSWRRALHAYDPESAAPAAPPQSAAACEVDCRRRRSRDTAADADAAADTAADGANVNV
jgi:hypothetical protein